MPTGNDLSHWLRAEDELCVRLPEVQQSGAWYTISAALAGLPADHIKVSVEDSGRPDFRRENYGSKRRRNRSARASSIFYTVRWPENISPETASAYLKNGTLIVVARKAGAERHLRAGAWFRGTARTRKGREVALGAESADGTSRRGSPTASRFGQHGKIWSHSAYRKPVAVLSPGVLVLPRMSLSADRKKA